MFTLIVKLFSSIFYNVTCILFHLSLVSSFENIVSGYISRNDSTSFRRDTSQVQVLASVVVSNFLMILIVL